MEKELQIMADRSHTLYIPAAGGRYHSVSRTLQESRHIFIEARLHALEKDFVRIVEIGFDTGLNAFLTLKNVELSQAYHIDYHTVELYPLPLNTIRALNCGESIQPERRELFLTLHEAEWGTPVSISERFTFHKVEGNSNTRELPDDIDLIYFDVFTPEERPGMWNQEIYNRLYAYIAPGGVIVTYCAKREVRRGIRVTDSEMSRLPSLPGKRHISRGIKN